MVDMMLPAVLDFFRVQAIGATGASQSGQVSGRPQQFVEHRRRESACEGVVLAGVIGPDKG
jgi:hypothetical protein